MKVAFLIPSVHTTACMAIRPWLLSEHASETLLITTPKLASAKSSPLKKARAILKESGFSYLRNQLGMTRAYRKLAAKEVQAGVTLSEQKAPSPESLVKQSGVTRIDQRSIKSKATRECLQAFAPEVMVAVFFNQIVGPKALAIPSKAALNVHPSLLPNYRGISPIFRALLNREAKTGASVHAMHKEIDFGDLYGQESLEIRASHTYAGLYQAVAQAAGEALCGVLSTFAQGEKPEVIEQVGEGAYFGPILKEEERQFRHGGRRWYRKQDFA